MDIIMTKSACFDAVISQESSEGKGHRHQEQPEGSRSQHLPCLRYGVSAHSLSNDSTQHASCSPAISSPAKPCLCVISATLLLADCLSPCLQPALRFS